MAVSVAGKVLLDTNIFIDFLRAGLHEDWVLGRGGNVTRFVPAVVLLELRLGTDTPKRKKVIERLYRALPSGRVLAPTAQAFDQAGVLFRLLYGNGSGLRDRLGPINDLLIAVTARHIGATVITGNLLEFRRIATKLTGLRIMAPDPR